jgi:hypothetical protein
MIARSQVHVWSLVVQEIGSGLDGKYSSEAVRNRGQSPWGAAPTIPKKQGSGIEAIAGLKPNYKRVPI